MGVGENESKKVLNLDSLPVLQLCECVSASAMLWCRDCHNEQDGRESGLIAGASAFRCVSASL